MGEALLVRRGGVSKPKLSSIEVHKPPTKTQYDDGETFDRTGMEVHAAYDDGHFLDVTAVASYSPDRPLTVGDTAITISYADGGEIVTATQPITVRYLTGIRITTPPTKTDYLKDETFAPAGMVVTADYSVGASATVSGYTVSPSGQLAVTDTEITVSYTFGSQTKTAKQSITVTEASVFGVMWNYGSTSTELTRLTPSNDPNGLVNINISSNPVPAVGTGAGSSPFDAYAPWSGMEEYNVINNAVSYKKGQSGFSRANNDTVVKIPGYYFKVVDDSANSKRYFYIASNPTTGFVKHPGSDRYIGKYNTITGHFSKTGSKPLAGTSRTSFRTSARAKGNGWYLYDYASWCALWLLYLVEFSDWNSQVKIGRGNVDSGYVQSNGGTDSMAYHTGRASGSDGSTQVQYRNVENPWGNVRDWLDGANFSERVAYLCTNPANYADDTSANYTATGVTLCTNGYIRNIGFSSAFPWAFLPSANGGSETTYVPDYVDSTPGWCALYVGGACSHGSNAGLFYFIANYAASSTHSYLGARLLFVP